MSDVAIVPDAPEQPESFFPGVRLATPADEDALYEFLLGLASENGLFNVDETRAREQIRIGTEGRGGVIGIIDGPNGIEASIGLFCETWWYSGDWFLAEKWVFVHPDHRRSSHAKSLIEFAKWTSERLRLPLLIGIITTQRTAAKERLYERQLIRAGGFYLWGLDYAPRLRDEIGATP